jgi:lipocalin
MQYIGRALSAIGALTSLPPPTAEVVDLTRLTGPDGKLYYEMRRLPVRYVPEVAYNITAFYALVPGQKAISVENSMDIDNPETKQRDTYSIRGTAVVDASYDDGSNSKLQLNISHPPRLSREPPGQYWILHTEIGADGTYETLVVSNSARTTLWILHDRPEMPAEKLKPLLTMLIYTFGFTPDQIRSLVRSEVRLS